MNGSVQRIVVSLGLVAGLAGVVGAKEQADYKPDSWITMKTKLALLTDTEVSGSSINVDTVNGRVTLHGKVETNTEKTRAADLAKRIEGAGEVRNLLQVVPDTKKSAMNVRDDEIKKRVEAALEKDAYLKNSSISVQSVNNGVVLLAGKASSMSDHLRAVQRARAIEGVRRVATEVVSPAGLTAGDLGTTSTSASTISAVSPKDTDKDTDKDTGKGVGDMASDSWITANTKLRLLANDSTPALDINVDTDHGVVTLFGVVPTEASKKAAETEASEVNGVRSVVNALQVVPKSAQKAVAATDAEVKKAAASALEGRDALKHVDVEVTNGVARLTGTVPDPSDRLHASVVVRSTPGVRSVRNDLRVSTQ